MNPILIGYRCCGKTSTGKILADLTGFDFIDTDQYIEQRNNMRISQMVAQKGWDYFRQAETRALDKTASMRGRVIATGGGIILAPRNREIIRANGFAVWLFADVHTIVARLKGDAENQASRPRFSDDPLEEETRTTLEQREPLYRDLAQMTIDTSQHRPDQAAQLIKRRFDHVRI